MTTWHCYRCVKDGLPEPVRAERAAEGLTIVNGTLTCVHCVRSDVQSAQYAREADLRSSRARRERSGGSRS